MLISQCYWEVPSFNFLQIVFNSGPSCSFTQFCVHFPSEKRVGVQAEPHCFSRLFLCTVATSWKPRDSLQGGGTLYDPEQVPSSPFSWPLSSQD